MPLAPIADSPIEHGGKQVCLDDYHAWVEDSEHKIVDPFANLLPHLKPFVHKPWRQLSPFYAYLLQNTLQCYKDKSRTELEEEYENVCKMFDHCLDKAVLLHMLHGHAIKLGSCGFVMEDGTIYEEYGNFKEKPDLGW